MAGSTIWAPKGEIGDKGPTGDKGPDGNQGPAGPPGPGAAEFAAYVIDVANATDPSKGVTLVGGGYRAVNTIAALRAMLKTSSPKVFVFGYYAPGDGGGGPYYYDSSDTTTADNGGTVIVAADGGRWKLSATGAVSLKQFGAKGDGTTDDTAAMQNLITSLYTGGRVGYIPKAAVSFRLTSTITVLNSVKLTGAGVEIYKGTITNNKNDRGSGAWIYFAHTGIGFNFNNAAGEMTNSDWSGFGTYRDHPNPGAGWAPTIQDFDFRITALNGDYYFHDLVLLNPYKGFHLNGRCTLENIKLQALNIAVETEICGDTLRLDKIHNWPFWSADSSVKAYMLANMTNFWLYRTDNPAITNCFSLWSSAGVRCSQGANGTVSRLRLSDCDFDASKYGFYIDSSVTNGVTAQISNSVTQGEVGVSNSTGIFVNGNNSRLDVQNITLSSHQLNSIRLDGTGNVINVGLAYLIDWNQSASGFSACYIGTGNTGNFNSFPSTPTAGVLFDGGGNTRSPLTSGEVSTTTDASGLVVVTHNAKTTPKKIYLQLRAPASSLSLRVSALTGTTFTVEVRTTTTNAVLASGAVQFYWDCEL